MANTTVLLVLQSVDAKCTKYAAERKIGNFRKIGFLGFLVPRIPGAENFIFSFDSSFQDLQNVVIKSILLGGARGEKSQKLIFSTSMTGQLQHTLG